MVNIVNVPSAYSSINDDLWFVCSSDKTGESSFKYIFDVKIGGNIVARVKVFPSIEGNYGIFNAAPIVRAFISNYFEPTGTSILVASNNKIKVDFTISIGEEYIVGQNLESYIDMANTIQAAYNYYQPLFSDIMTESNGQPLILNDFYDNLLVGNFQNEWITDRSIDKIGIEYGDNFFITYLKIDSINFVGKLDVISESGQVLATHSEAIGMSGQMNLFNLQAGALNEWVGSNLITESTYGYRFSLIPQSETIIPYRTLTFVQKCYPKHRQFNLHFLNRLGGYDTMKFALVNRRKTEFNRAYYRRSAWQLSGNNMTNTDSFNRYNETSMPFAVQHKDTFKLTSDWVNEQDYEWLGQLVGSPSVYVEFNGAFYPVMIITNTHDYKLERADGLFNFEIDIEIGKYINSQFR